MQHASMFHVKQIMYYFCYMPKKTKLSDLIPDDKNFNQGSEFGNSLIEKSFRKFGAGRSILIDKNNRIIAGNKSVKNAAAIGLEDVQIVESDGKKIIAVKRTDIDLDSPEGREMALADNASAKANIVFDAEVVEAELGEAVCEEWGVELSEKLEEEEGEDNIPEADAISTEGDLWELNNHRLLCGSSCNIDDIDNLMNNKKADLIFTDPPYDLEDEYSVFILSQAKEDCHVFIMNSDKLLIENIKNNQEYFRKMFFVDFRQARLVSNNQPMTRVDPIAEFLKGKGKFNNMRDGFSTLIECAKIHNNNAEQNHGFNQAKKVELPETFVLHYSKPNELVCDFFGGAGSTLIACEKNNRNCYIMEFDPKNVDIIVKRWVEYMVKNDKLYDVKLNGKKYDKNLFKSLETNNLVEN